MNTLLKNHFDVQTGMYFSRSFSDSGWIFFTSDIIEDGFWNYAILPEGRDSILSLPSVEAKFKSIGRSSSIYVINESARKNDVEILKQQGYEKMAQESFMTFAGDFVAEGLPKNIQIIQASSANEITDFIEVFTNAYGGEKSSEQPYGELDETYIRALLESFNDTTKFYHYICYAEEKPVAVATLCLSNGIGGIYNVGTNPCDRGKGYGSLVTKACISEWQKKNGSVLLLQTETGSAVEKWYYSLGFKLEFYGSTFYRGLI